ncbi:uncharacterized protein PAN0_012d4532 [Moesziomyces antarcticus]|uniref:Uncharacterized protein n=2 Tax=Pseudozyma antarctica TaxID=84753 RepID=A0A5C3FVX0_PSEA2|nr:uncharacterized protein PAN0_012d4532 [Moesziomyces antarcticus]GAK66310.1 hypothetical protein PAN0_012d4532 [Moesziomyces antarcticus]SPO48494.1 uncharacterized protein PSANT_06185 [Moesziomyces antarcticus]
MEPALPLPLRLELAHAPVSMDHTAVSESISSFLAQYAARTGTHNASEDAAGSTGGVVAAQLTRLMNGLAGKIDYDAFTAMIAGTVDEEMETPMEVLEPSTQQEPQTKVHEEQVDQATSTEKEMKDKKEKKDKKDKKDRKKKDKVKSESS